MIKDIEYPFTLAKVKELVVGDTVSLTGRIFTGRDRLHGYLTEDGKCPISLKDAGIYHCGPVVLRKDGAWVVRAAGPTTSKRHDSYMPTIIERYRVRVVIGKGGMGEATRKACKKFGCVYLQTVGGAAALLAGTVEQVADVHFLKEFGATEALWELDVRGFPAVVTIDAEGHSLHRRVKMKSSRTLLGLLRPKGRSRPDAPGGGDAS